MNLQCSGGLDEAFLDAIQQINPSVPYLRPTGTLDGDEENWCALFTNCDSDFLVAHIAEPRKQELERILADWTISVVAAISEFSNGRGLFDGVTMDAMASRPGAPTRQRENQDQFVPCLNSFAATQRRVVRQTVETCARLILAGMEPIPIAILAVDDLRREFKAQLRSWLRTTRPEQHPTITLTAENLSAEGDGELSEPAIEVSPEDIAELLTTASKRIDSTIQARADYWREFKALIQAPRALWDDAMALVTILGPNPIKVEADLLQFVSEHRFLHDFERLKQSHPKRPLSKAEAKQIAKLKGTNPARRDRLITAFRTHRFVRAGY